MHQDDTSGVMAIEACVSLTFFMIIMYALYSMVPCFLHRASSVMR